jgi:sugar lactone lactonase YvrE
MNTISAVATDAAYELAEGVLWDDRADLVRWVDINAGHVLAGFLNGSRIEGISTVSIGSTAGAVALAQDGGLLVAAARGLATISPSGELSVGPDLLGRRRDVRLNDGTVDPQGAFLVGTLSLTDRTDEEVLLRVHPDGRVETLREGIGLSNGIAFAPDGMTVFHTDTLAGTVSKHSYGPGPFDVDEPWVIVLEDLPALPDGLTVDAAGGLWVAEWGGACVRRYSPTGVPLATVRVDAVQASCPGFVGPDLDTLAVTTAQLGLDGVTDQSGALFLAALADWYPEVRGIAPHRWAGSTTTPYWRTDD